MIIFAFILLPTIGSCDNDESAKTKDIISIRAGFWGPGSVSVSGRDYDLKSGYSLGLNVDTPKGNRYYTGFAIDIYRIYPDDTDESVSLYNFGFVVKRDYPIKNSKLSFRPSITLGFALKPELSFVDNSGHFTIKIAADLISQSTTKYKFLIEGGFFWAIAGMTNQDKIYSFPAPLLRAGLMF